MLHTIARVLSVIFYPLVIIIPMPFLLVFKTSQNVSYSLLWTFFTYLYLGVFGLFMLFALWRGVFSDVDVSRRAQRPLLFFSAATIACCYLLSLFYFNGPRILLAMGAGALFSILVISLVNRKIKASLHMAGVTAGLIAIGVLYGVNAIAFILIPLVAWARIKVKRHTLRETIAGILCGAFVTLVVYISIRYLFSLPI